MSPEPFALLVCPLCGDDLAMRERALRCGGGHSFDLARQGYVNLLPGDARPGTADSAQMVEARTAFLTAGHYAPLADAIATAAAEAVPADRPATVLDAGAGTGYYLAAVLDALPQAAGLALDVSKFALRRAARAHPRAAAAVWDVWRPLPVRSGAVDLLLNVFAPRNPAEFHRVLRDDGTLLVVTPQADHLAQLREARSGMLEVDGGKAERLAGALTDSGLFRAAGTVPLSYPLALGPEQAADAVGMGPSARHADRLAGAAPLTGTLEVTAAFLLSAYRPVRSAAAGGRVPDGPG